MKTYQIVFPAVLSLILFAALPGCDAGNEAADTTGLSQVTLHIEGMT